jgi:hypothetical protein
LPVELVTYICFNDKYKAYNFEKYLKSGSGKAYSKKDQQETLLLSARSKSADRE